VPSEDAQEPRRPLAWLALGAALGVALAALGLLAREDPGAGLPPHAVARVNGVVIQADEFERLLAGIESDSRAAVGPETRRRVLDRLIEEELLVQRGLELGLAESDRRVRADLTSAVIHAVLMEAEDEVPDEAALRAFYQEQRDFFTRPGRLRLQQIFFRVPDLASEQPARARAEAAFARLAAGEPFEAVAESGDAPLSPLPDALLPPTQVREVLGPTALRTALELEPGRVSAPVRSGIGYHLLRLVAREEPAPPPFETIVEQVQSEFVRRAGERALRRYLDELRARAEIAVAADLP
jgi:parvulin-like peptidyl-prolyl isomerase